MDCNLGNLVRQLHQGKPVTASHHFFAAFRFLFTILRAQRNADRTLQGGPRVLPSMAGEAWEPVSLPEFNPGQNQMHLKRRYQTETVRRVRWQDDDDLPNEGQQAPMIPLRQSSQRGSAAEPGTETAEETPDKEGTSDSAKRPLNILVLNPLNHNQPAKPIQVFVAGSRLA